MNILQFNIPKKVLATAGLLLTLTLFTCTEDLDITDPNRLSPEVFWRNQTDAEAGLTAVYASLPSIPAFGRIGVGLLLIQRSDEVDPFPQINVNDGGIFGATPDFPRLREPWQELYKQISAANQVLANVPNIDFDAARKAEILGEARFLRAHAYFYLVNQWGNIPLALEEISEGVEQIFIGNSTPEQVFDAMIEDLKVAQSALPQTWSADQVGRASWGAATALLGKCYLYTDQWSSAAAEFKKVIDSGLYELTTDYFDNFREETTNNVESLFEVQYDGNTTGGWGGTGANVWRGQAWEADIAPRAFSSQQSVTVNQWVFDLFMAQQTVDGDEDPRAKATMVWNYPGAMMYQTAFTDAFNGVDLERIWVRKYLNFENDTALAPGNWAGDTNNWRLIRFADILLMYAEAVNESSGPDPEAFDAINLVRARAKMPAYDGMDQATLRQAIRDERVRELAIEGYRWWDLRRWGIAADRFQKNPELRGNSGGQFVTGKHEYYPLPRQDVDSNPNLNQNPGY